MTSYASYVKFLFDFHVYSIHCCFDTMAKQHKNEGRSVYHRGAFFFFLFLKSCYHRFGGLRGSRLKTPSNSAGTGWNMTRRNKLWQIRKTQGYGKGGGWSLQGDRWQDGSKFKFSSLLCIYLFNNLFMFLFICLFVCWWEILFNHQVNDTESEWMDGGRCIPASRCPCSDRVIVKIQRIV